MESVFSLTVWLHKGRSIFNFGLNFFFFFLTGTHCFWTGSHNKIMSTRSVLGLAITICNKITVWPFFSSLFVVEQSLYLLKRNLNWVSISKVLMLSTYTVHCPATLKSPIYIHIQLYTFAEGIWLRSKHFPWWSL